ncbi:MAG: hypothetical protein FWD47_09505 [Treponema sp.]|nr:hypothetical protein [Treponema sp.]
MLKKVLLLVTVFAILSVSAVTALERNLGRFDLVLEDNFQYEQGYVAQLNHPVLNNVNLFNSHRLAAGETYSIRMRFTASRDLEDELTIFLVDGTEEAGWWTELTDKFIIENVRGNREVSVTVTFTTTKASTCSLNIANMMGFASQGSNTQGRRGTAGSGVRGPVTLRFTEFVLTGGPNQPAINFNQNIFLKADNWDILLIPENLRGISGSVQSRREAIQRVQRDVVSFTANLPRSNDYRQVRFDNWRMLQRLQVAATGIIFKVLGDRGEGWFVEIGVGHDDNNHRMYEFPLNTINNEVVEFTIPFSRFVYYWGYNAPFNRSEITSINFVRKGHGTIHGASTIKVFDFDTF